MGEREFSETVYADELFGREEPAAADCTIQYRGNIMSAVAAMARLKDVRIFLTRPFFIMCFFVSANLDMNGVGPVQKKKNDFLKSE